MLTYLYYFFFDFFRFFVTTIFKISILMGNEIFGGLIFNF